MQTVSTLIMNMESTAARMKSAARRILLHLEPLTKAQFIQRFDKVRLEEVNSLATDIFSSPYGAAAVGAGANRLKNKL